MRKCLGRHNKVLAVFVVLAASTLLCTLLLSTASAGRARHSLHGWWWHHGKLSITCKDWGTLPVGPQKGQHATLCTLTNRNGMQVNITNYGATVQSIWVPDRSGKSVNVALGFATLSDYVNDTLGQPWPAAGGSGEPYFGAIIGRYANRIANASFSLNSTTYTLPANNGPNTLHGGPDSYNCQLWAATPLWGPGYVALKLTYTDPAGFNGFPAEVANTVTYKLTNDNALRMDYLSHNNDSKLSTVINLTNHLYFNLAGEGSGDVKGQYLQMSADQYTPVNGNLIPAVAAGTAGVSVAGTPFDFRKPKPIGQDIESTAPDNGGQPLPQIVIAHGFDHNWVLNGYPGYRLVSTAFDKENGITLWTFTDQPGVQFYSGNFLVGDLTGTSGHLYRQTDGFTLETQHYPDSPHHQGDAAWPSVVLAPGADYVTATTYQFGVKGHW
jgi:aldose 1-epimerase